MPFLSLRSPNDLYYVWRASEGPTKLTILFVHGLGSSSSFYAPVFPSLVAQGYSCLAFDTRGSCMSKQAGDCSVQDIADDATALLKALSIGPDKVVAVGHSMGGMVASTLASQYALAGTVLLGSVTPSEGLASAFTGRIKAVLEGGMEPMADSVPPNATGSGATPTHHAFIRALLLSQTPEGYASLCRTIATAKTPDYAAARSPALFIAGEEDKVAPRQDQEKIAQAWAAGKAKTSVHVLEKVGHWPCVEAGERVAELLLEFAKGLEA